VSRRPWLIPIFALTSLAFITLQYGEHYEWYGPSPLLFVGICFLGLTIFEVSEIARNLIHFLPFIMCIVVAAAIGFAYLVTPSNPGFLWYWNYVPLFALIVVEVLLLWSLAPKESDSDTNLVGLKIKYSFFLLFLLTLLGGSNVMYGQMVSFFFMTVPVVLSWEEVIHRSRIVQGRESSGFKGPAIRTALALVVSFIAGTIGVSLGNSFWVT
jgi:hypothetical protein